MRVRPAKVWAVTAAVTVALGVTGCTAGDPPPAPGVSSTPAASAAAASIPAIPPGDGIISAVTMTSLSKKPGTTVKAKGTLTMPAHHHGTVVVSVSWVNRDTATVYARGVTTLHTVEPGTTRTWTTSAVLAADATKVRAILGAVITKG